MQFTRPRFSSFFRRVAPVLAAVCLAAMCAAAQPAAPAGAPGIGRPWPADPDKFTFAILGDKTGGGEENWPLLDRAVDEINVLRPDFVLMPGDMVQGYTADRAVMDAQWAEFREHAGRLEVPLLLLPGNHDISNEVMLAYWREHLGRTYHAFRYKGCHFLMLNTHEHFAQGVVTMGAEQLAWARDELAAAGDARHTFVLMHVPLWYGPSPDWAVLDEALGGRPATIIGAHHHRAAHERDGTREYIVLGPTGGGLDPQPLKPLGRFHHFTVVTVEEDKVHLALVEPGAVWPRDTAPRAFQDAAGRLLRVRAVMPGGAPQGGFTPGVECAVDNALPGPVTLRVLFRGLDGNSWRRAQDGTPGMLTVKPGEEAVLRYGFSAGPERVLPVPRIRVETEYDGQTLSVIERNVPLYPEDVLRSPGAWHAVGPFDAGELPRALPPGPREAMPGAWREHGPESGYAADARYTSGGRELAWVRLEEQPQFGPGFLNLLPIEATPFNTLAYAVCAVHSPADTTVFAQFRVDDYGQILVNGTMVDGGQLHRTRSDPAWVALPLRAGWNEVTVKAYAISGGWSFRLRFADPDNALEFRRHLD